MLCEGLGVDESGSPELCWQDARPLARLGSAPACCAAGAARFNRAGVAEGLWSDSGAVRCGSSSASESVSAGKSWPSQLCI